MKTIINTLKNGTGKTKAILILALLSAVGSAGLLVSAVFFGQILLFFGALVMMFVAISLFQTFELSDHTLVENEKSDISEADNAINALNNEQYDEYNTHKTAHENEMNRPAYEDNTADSQIDGAVDENMQYNDASNMYGGDEAYNENENIYQDDEIYENEESDVSVKKKSKKTKKTKKNKNIKDTKKTKSKKQKIDEDYSEKIDENISENLDEEQESSKKLHIVRQASDEVIATYDKKKIKKTLHKFKVKRDHRMVLIDSCEKYYIKQTPAYVWVAQNEFHMLLIEEEPRHIALSVNNLREVRYLKKIEANQDTDYPQFHKKTMLTELFRPYLPDYTVSTVVDDVSAYKNLYSIGPDIRFTNRSAKSLFDLLPVDFIVEDKVTMSTKVNYYFKEAYKSSILLRDNVIDANGYADRISNTLDNMAKSTISYNEFKETLNLMMKNKLITQEFAMHFMDVRDKIRR